jgi:hypothetical protein
MGVDEGGVVGGVVGATERELEQAQDRDLGDGDTERGEQEHQRRRVGQESPRKGRRRRHYFRRRGRGGGEGRERDEERRQLVDATTDPASPNRDKHHRLQKVVTPTLTLISTPHFPILTSYFFLFDSRDNAIHPNGICGLGKTKEMSL